MATAVSLRKGSTEEHREFKGDLGEVTVDTDIATLYVHLGNKQPGTPLAKANMDNVSQDDIAKRGMAKLDLTNISIPSEKINDVRANLSPLTYAQTDGTDIHTNVPGGLADTTRNAAIYGKALAYADLANVDKSAITDKGIAQTDLDNVTTETVVSKLTVDNNHLYADRDLNNVTTVDLATGAGTLGKHAGLNLAYANLSNLESLGDATKTALYNNGVQLTSKLVQDVDIGTENDYPSATAVKTKIDSISKLPGFNSRGTESYQVLITSFVYAYDLTNTDAGEGYQVNDQLSLINPDSTPNGIVVNVLTVETDTTVGTLGEIKEFEVLTTHGNDLITGTFDCRVNLTQFVGLPSLSSAEFDPATIENKVYTVADDFETNIDFVIGIGISEPAGTMIKCINTAAAEQTPVYKWAIVTNPSGAQFTVSSQATGITPGINSQISWVNLQNPITIRDTQMEDETGLITVVFSRTPKVVKIKKLIGGEEIVGTWSSFGITMTFTPSVPADVLLDSWVIAVDG